MLRREKDSSKVVVGWLESERERESVGREVEELKEREKELRLELLAEKEKFRREMLSREAEYLRSKESTSEQLSRIESKYQLLES